MKSIYFLIVFILLEVYGSAQADNTYPVIPNSEAISSLKSFQLSGDLYTGKVNFNIPVYSLELSQGIDLPINLVYNGGNGIKISELPTWVGLGWRLAVGGQITRIVKNQPDEYRALQTSTNVVGNTVVTSTYISSKDASYITNYSKLNRADWSQTSFLNTLNTNSPYYSSTISNANPLDDFEPDEFDFELNGISGRFMLDHLGNWIVITDAPGIKFKVEPTIQTFVKIQNKIIPRAIVEFKLTSSDGTIYFFGENTVEYPKNIEYNYNSFWEPSSSPTGPYTSVMPSTWHLTKIQLTNGDEVKFSYRKIAPQSSKNLTYWGNYPAGSNTIPEIPSERSLSKYLTDNWYLEQIEYENIKILFNSSNSNQLGSNELIQSAFNYFNDVNSAAPPVGSITNSYAKLNSIKIIYKGYTKKSFAFAFIENSTERLKLEYFRETDNIGNIATEYKFIYNNNKLPEYASGKMDHWGYYNGTNFFEPLAKPYTYAGLVPGFSNSKNSNYTFAYNEILETIILPTRGKIIFTYEPNKYSKKANLWPFDITTVSQDVESAGVRIKKVSKKSESDALLEETEYEYIDEVSQRSTGILAVPIPDYISGNSTQFNFRAEGFNAFNNRGPAVVYSVVKEKTSGNGYRKYYYESFENVCNDLIAITYLPAYSNFISSCYNSRMNLRSKLRFERIYREDGTLLSEIENIYQHNSTSSKQQIRSIHYLPSIRWNDNIFRAAAYDTDFYEDLLVTTTEKFYDANQNALTQSVVNLYDEFNNLIKSTHSDSKGNERIKSIIYPPALIDPISNLMTNSFVVNKQINVKDETFSAGISSPVSSTVTNYIKLTGNLFVPTNIQFQKGTNALVERMKFDQYDSKGNLLQSSTPGNSLKSSIWGYDKRYKIADIINAKSNEVFYNGFEEDMGWDSGLTGYDLAISHNGRYSGKIEKMSVGKKFSYCQSPLSINLNAPTTFVYSAWVYSDGPSVDINLFMKKADQSEVADNMSTSVINKWVLIKKEFIVSADVVNLKIRIDNNGGGTVWFDDVKIYPASSQLTTVAFDPFIGISSQMDVNDQSTHYEYDNFGRLSIIRDNDRNILRKICYNIQGMSGSCEIYKNLPINDYFYSQNCTPGLPPFSYFVSIPAGMFISSTNQNDANVLAQQYAQLLANQNGRCLNPSFELYCYNYTFGSNFLIELYNHETGNSYYYNPTDETTLLGSIPEGTYDVYIWPINGNNNYYSYVVGCTNTISGTSGAFFSSITLGANCNSITIH